MFYDAERENYDRHDGASFMVKSVLLIDCVPLVLPLL